MFNKSFILLWIFRFYVVLVNGKSRVSATRFSKVEQHRQQLLAWNLPGGCTKLSVLAYELYSNQRDQCSTSTNQAGVCTTIKACPLIYNELTQGNSINYEVCGFEPRHVKIVCCPSEDTKERISIRKCNEYKEFAYDKTYRRDLYGLQVEDKKTNCAFTSIPLIVGGIEAKQREFPHMALIGFVTYDNNGIPLDWTWICGGTLISEKFVLSAAHCMTSMAKYVRLGDHNLDQTDEASHVDYNIIEKIPHPEYRYIVSHYNDIGLFKLDSGVQFNSAIRPACLPEQFAVTKRTAIATGWGHVEYAAYRGSNVLLKVTLEFFSQQECNSNYTNDWRLDRGILENSQICAGSKYKSLDTCQGDSGGPLQIYHSTHDCAYTIVGVTSFGKVCGTIGIPGVYTRVYNYLSWIEGIVWPNE